MSYSKADIEKIIQLINEGDVEALKAQEFEQFQYQGFDPLQIANALHKVKVAKSVSDDDFRKDVYTMVAIGIIKGSVNDRNIKKISETGQTELSALITKYGIRMGGGKGQQASVITFPRVMATFPDIAVRLVAVIGAKEFRGGPFRSSRLPEFMKIQVFPAIIPKDTHLDVKRMLLMASLCYSVDQSIQISQIQKPDIEDLTAKQLNYTNIGFNSPVPADDIRRRVFDKLGILEEYPKVIEVLTDYKQKIDPTFIILNTTQFTERYKLRSV
jgi:hypothetical protein